MLSDYSRYEIRSAVRPYHLAVLTSFMAGSVGLSFLFPSMPEAIYRFFKKVFAMNNWTEIILINDFMGIFFILFWIGMIDLLRVYVLPKEEGYLELLLSKPLSRAQYLFANVLPAFGVLAGIGGILSLFLPLKIAIINGTADLHLAGVVCAGMVTTALALSLLALLNLVFLFAKETYYAVLLAFVVFTLAVLPGSLFMYRPDVFQDHPLLRNLIIFPGNLLWFSESLPKITPIILLSAITASVLLLAGSSRYLSRSDIL
jgi:ABC-type transport system involved in multi-copper enzyme maturation permease subunit